MRLEYLPIAILLLLIPGAAEAHVGLHNNPAGLSTGMLHPFSGLDHILAMVAVGMWAGWLGNRFRWSVPVGFVSAAAIGFLLGINGSEAFGMVEQGIAMSLVGLGALLFFRARLTLPVALPLIAAFGVFHGLAHGSEVAVGAGMWLFMAGFVSSTACLHLAGVLIGMSAAKEIFLRLGGAGIATAGILLVALN